MAVSFCASLHTKSVTPLPGAGSGQCKYTGQSVRALPVRILTVGKKRSRGLQLVVDEYIGKLKLYCSVDDVQRCEGSVDDEDAAVMNLIRPDDWVVMLDENGQDVRSEQMAELVGDAGNTGASRLSFCIGGPYGHGQKLRERANVSIRLSTLVLNHQIALLVLMEQLYRSGEWQIACFKMDDYLSNKQLYLFEVMDYSEGTKIPSLDTLSHVLNHV